MVINDIIQIIVGSGIIISIIKVIFTMGKMTEKLQSLEQKVDRLDQSIQDLSNRVSRIEGHLWGAPGPDIKEHKKPHKHRR